MTNDELVRRSIDTIRFLAADAVEKAGSGHPGTPMALAPLAYLLWTRHLRFNPGNPDWPGRDRFVLSCGHSSMLLYAVLFLTGYDLPLDELKRYRQWGSRTPGHPEKGHTAGVEVTTGPLGQGIANAVGMAMASRFLAHRFNRPGHEIVSHRIVVMCSDGDLMEGIGSESASLAGLHRLGNLVAFYDDNKTTIDGKTDVSFSEDVAARFLGCGWKVVIVEDGNTDIEGLATAADRAFAAEDRPALVIVRTEIAFGSPHKQGDPSAHGSPLGEEEVALTKEAFGWPPDAHFLVPEDVLAHYREAVERGATLEGKWREKMARYEKECPDLAREWERTFRGDLPDGWANALPRFAPEDGPMATRSASGKVINALARGIPELIGGSADLGGSNKTHIGKGEPFLPGSPENRNIYFGVREHGMGGILNGMALHGGLHPYGGTFLIFSDYMRPAIRLAALTGIDVVYVFTHDSVGLGGDGPTHQPVEHIASLRAMPNMYVLRPADANETAAAWTIAMERRGGPSAILLTRQKIPVLSRESVYRDGDIFRGGYILEEGSGGTPGLILVASGSEVHVAREARKTLEEEGIPTRVVSFLCWERFEEQPDDYRNKVFPPSLEARVSVEAASVFGWERYVGTLGASVGIDRYGASAPGSRVLAELGINPENVVARAKSVLGRIAARAKTGKEGRVA